MQLMFIIQKLFKVIFFLFIQSQKIIHFSTSSLIQMPLDMRHQKTFIRILLAKCCISSRRNSSEFSLVFWNIISKILKMNALFFASFLVLPAVSYQLSYNGCIFRESYSTNFRYPCKQTLSSNAS